MLYDVNDHPKQEEVNEEIGRILGDTFRKLERFNDQYAITTKSAHQQFLNAYLLFLEHHYGIPGKEMIKALKIDWRKRGIINKLGLLRKLK